MMIKIKRNDYVGIIGDLFRDEQHPNQKGGLPLKVKAINFDTLNVNTVKVYENSKGMYIKMGKHNHYLANITKPAYFIQASVVDVVA